MMATSNSSGEDTLAIHVEMALQRFKVLLTGEMDDEAETYRITYLKVCIFIFSFQIPMLQARYSYRHMDGIHHGSLNFAGCSFQMQAFRCHMHTHRARYLPGICIEY